MRVEADVVVRRSAAIDIARQQRGENAPHALPPCWSVPPQQLGGLIDAMLATLTGKEVTAALASLAGTDILAIPQPRIMHIVTGRPIPDVLDTTGLRAIPDAPSYARSIRRPRRPLGFPSYRGDIALKEVEAVARHGGSSIGTSGRVRCGWSGRPVSRSRR